MLVVLVVALIFLGPARLPGAARQLGQAVREFRRVTGDFQAEVRDAFSDPGTYAGPPPETPEQAELPRPVPDKPVSE